jgi:hypothetical protein
LLPCRQALRGRLVSLRSRKASGAQATPALGSSPGRFGRRLTRSAVERPEGRRCCAGRGYDTSPQNGCCTATLVAIGEPSITAALELGQILTGERALLTQLRRNSVVHVSAYSQVFLFFSLVPVQPVNAPRDRLESSITKPFRSKGFLLAIFVNAYKYPHLFVGHRPHLCTYSSVGN